MEKETKDQNNNTSNKRNIKFVDLPRYYTYTDKRNDSYTTFKEIEDLIKEAQKYVDDEGKYAYRSYNEILDNPIFSSRYAKNDKNSVKSWRDVNFPRDIIYAILIKAMPENEKMKYITSRSRNYRTGELEEPDENSYVYYDSTGHELNYNEGLYLLNKYPGLKMVALGLNNKDIVRDFLTYKDPRDKIEQDVKFGQNGRYISSYERYMENADEHPKLIISNPLSTKESIHPIRIANQSEDSQDIHTTNSVNYNTGVLGGGQPGNFNIKPLFLNVPFFEDSNYSNVPTNYNYSYSEDGLPFLIPNMRGYYTIASLKSPFDVNYSDYDWSDLDSEEDKRPPRYQDINYLHLLLPEMFSDLRKRLFQKDPNERQILVHYAADGGQLEQRSEPTLLLKAMMSADPELYGLAEGFDKYDADDLYLEMMKELVEPLGIKRTFTNKNNKEDDNRHRITIRKFDDGGAMVIDKNGEFVNNQSWSSYKDWKALKNIDYEVVPDTTFTREKTGVGDIEYFNSEHPEGITYNNGYHKPHPMPGKDVILYNPKTNDEQDIRLDALHIMPKDPTYDTLNILYRHQGDGDIIPTAEYERELDLRQYLRDMGQFLYGLLKTMPEYPEPLDVYIDNAFDGLLRNMFIEGDKEYITRKKYDPNKDELKLQYEYLMPYINNILLYLESGQRPTWIQTRDDDGNILTSRLLPEIYVDENHSWYPNGGKINKFKPGGYIEKSWKSPEEKQKGYYLTQQALNLTDFMQLLNNIVQQGKSWREDYNNWDYRDIEGEYPIATNVWEDNGRIPIYKIPGSAMLKAFPNYTWNNGLTFDPNINYYTIKNAKGLYALVPLGSYISELMDLSFERDKTLHPTNIATPDMTTLIANVPTLYGIKPMPPEQPEELETTQQALLWLDNRSNWERQQAQNMYDLNAWQQRYNYWLNIENITRDRITRPFVLTNYVRGGLDAINGYDSFLGSFFDPNKHGMWVGPEGRAFLLNHPFVSGLLDFGVDILGAKAIKPIGNFASNVRGFRTPSITRNPNYYYRQGVGLIEDARQSGVIRVGVNPLTGRLGFQFPFFQKGTLHYGDSKWAPDIILNKGKGNFEWLPVNSVGFVKPGQLDYNMRTPLVNGQTNMADASLFSTLKPVRVGKRTIGYIEKPLMKNNNAFTPTLNSTDLKQQSFTYDPITGYRYTGYKRPSMFEDNGIDKTRTLKLALETTLGKTSNTLKKSQTNVTSSKSSTTPRYTKLEIVEGAKVAERQALDYLGSEEHILQIMKGGKSREEATTIANEMYSNALGTRYAGAPSGKKKQGNYNTQFGTVNELYRNMPEASVEEAINSDWTFKPEYQVSQNARDLTETVLHEYGGHGATLGYDPEYLQMLNEVHPELGTKYLDTMSQWFPHYLEVYNFNAKLKPVRKPEYTGNLSERVKNDIEYLEDVDEYSARARAARMGKDKGYKPGNDFKTEDFKYLEKYFTKESLEKLINNVWGISVPITGGILLDNN